MTISVEIVTRSDPGTVVATLDETFDRRFRDELNDAAASQFSAANTDADLAVIEDDDAIAVVRNDGEYGFAFFIDSSDRQTVAGGEEHDQVTEFAGRHVTSILDESVIDPARGPDVLPVEVDRMFAWPSPEYDESTYPSGWTSAVQIAQQSTATTYWTGYPADSGSATWVDTTAYWIGSSTGDDDDAPLGVEYFRRTYTVATAGFYVVQFGAFYYGDVWVDGQHIATTASQIGLLQQETIELTAGEHTFAFVVANVDNGGDNPAGGIFALHPLNNDGTLGSVVMHSDSSWSMLAFPTDGQPGMTTGEVLISVLDESQGRGDLDGLVWDFTADLDSNGNPWIGTDHPDVQEGTLFDCATKVGTSLLEFLIELSATYVDFWVDITAGALTLHVVNKGTRGTGSGVTLTPGENVLTLRHRRRRPYANDVLVAWSGGFHRVVDAASVASHGRRGRLLSLGAQQSIVSVEAITLSELAVFGQPMDETIVTHAELGGWPYSPGDTVSVPNRAGTPTDMRVQSVTVTEDENGVLTFSPTFGEPT